MKVLYIFFLTLIATSLSAQFNPLNPPNDCSEAVPGCTAPAFPISPNVPGTNNVDFGTGTFSNPNTNPNASPGNTGCLLSGETSSTFITISIVTTGTLAWSIQGPSGGCFDWIMWPYQNTAATCSAILNAQLAPISCNWNAPCQGYTGMASPGQLPVGANQGNFENAISVVAGQQFLLCLSNFSGTNQNVNFNFFGTANVACSVSAPDKTICLGNSTTVTINTPGYVAPIFTWLVTNGVSNINGGTNVVVNPTVTTTYKVKVVQLPTGSSSQLIDTAVFTIFVQAPPTPNAGLDDTVCFGSPINLTGNISLPSNSKSWNYFSLGVIPTPTIQFSPNFSSLTPTVTVNQPGQYGFILRETSPVCGQIRDTVLIYMKQMTSVVTAIPPSCEGDMDGSIQLSGPGATNYSFDKGLTWGTQSTASGFASGTYDVCVKDSRGCVTCIPVTLVDPVPVVIQTSNDTIVCQNGVGTISASAIGGNNFIYHWSQTTNTNSTQAVTPIQATYYLVNVENQNGCQSAMDSIYVDVLPAISGTISMNDTVCPGYSTVLMATASDGFGGTYDFNWSTSDVHSGSTSNITISPTASSGYSVTIIDACESSPLLLNTYVEVSPVPVPALDVTEGQICEPAVFSMNITTDPTTYNSSSFLLSDGQFYMNTDSPSTIAMDRGFYNVQLILVNEHGCIDSIHYEDFLESMSKPNAFYRYNPSSPTMFNTAVQFDNLSTGSVNYAWEFEKGNPAYSMDAAPRVLFPDGYTGNYGVLMIAYSDFGCADSLYSYVEVLPEVILYAPNAFTPDNDKHNQDWFVTIEGIDPYSFELEVRDRWGNSVWRTEDVNGRWDGTFNNEILPTGSYSWLIKASDMLTGKSYVFNGLVNLIK
jgi:gliding motility-associated-like protein